MNRVVIGAIALSLLFAGLWSCATDAQQKKGSRRTGRLAHRNDVVNSTIKRYRWKVEASSADANSGIVVEDLLKDGALFQRVSLPRPGTVVHVRHGDIATPGSHDIEIRINDPPGSTRCAGLIFRNPVILGILADGMVVVDKLDISVTDAKGKVWVSRKVSYNGKSVIAFVPGQGKTPPAVSKPRTADSQPELSAATRKQQPTLIDPRARLEVMPLPIPDGPHMLQILNGKENAVTVVLHTARSAREFTVGEHSEESVPLPAGTYRIFFIFADEPDILYQGDDITLRADAGSVCIFRLTLRSQNDGNYAVHRVD